LYIQVETEQHLRILSEKYNISAAKLHVNRLCAQLEELARKLFHKETSLSALPESPLKRLAAALELFEKPFAQWTVLSRSFFHALAHPICIG
jgi:hypothetical protein